jgi:hypothetical protein
MSKRPREEQHQPSDVFKYEWVGKGVNVLSEVERNSDIGGEGREKDRYRVRNSTMSSSINGLGRG